LNRSVINGLDWRTRLAAVAIGLLLVCAGCGAQRTSPVEGVVLLDGKPVAGASVQFVPQDKGRDATGETDKDGHFALSTFQPRDGAVPGSYKVIISPPTGSADTSKYGSADEAMAAAARQPQKRDSAASSFPQKYTRADQTPLKQDVPAKGKLTLELSR
jgi:hypothetical protein